MRARFGISLVTTVVISGAMVGVPASAHAVTIPRGVHTKVTIAAGVLKITDGSKGSVANGDFDNSIDVKIKRDEGVAYVMEDDGDIIAGPGCQTGSFNEDTSHNRPEDAWAAGWGPWQAKCTLTPKVKKVDVNSGAGDDVVNVLLSPFPVSIEGGAGGDDLEYWSLDGDQSPPPYWSTSTINGGLGDDYLVGGRGNDTVIGDRGFDWVEGTCGSDNLQGGADDDSIDAFELGWGNMDCPAAKDTINCGDGGDSADIDQGLDVVKNCESTFTG